MTNLLQSEEFLKLEEQFPFLRRARETALGLKALNYIIVDIETTGLEPAQNEIIEIAALKIEKGEIRDVFNHLIQIPFPLPKEIIKITEITDEMLVEGGEKKQILKNFTDFIGNTPLVAHNVEFDIPFLKHHLEKSVGQIISNLNICTLKLSRRLLPGLPGYKLQKVAEHFEVQTPVLHRAIADTEITFQVWLKLIDILEQKGVSTLEALLKLV